MGSRSFKVFLVKTPASSDADIKKKEESIMELGRLLMRNKQTQELRRMIVETHPFLASLGIAKAAKLLRNLVDLCLMIDDQDENIKIELVRECIQWAVDHNRTYLRQTLEARLIRLFNDLCRHTQALSLGKRNLFIQFFSADLIRELKKLDDKDVLMQVELEESKAFYHLRSIEKARTSLTAARSIANSMYVPPKMQASVFFSYTISDESCFQLKLDTGLKRPTDVNYYKYDYLYTHLYYILIYCRKKQKFKFCFVASSLLSLCSSLNLETSLSLYIFFVQAALDLQSGILSAADETDFLAAFSYFYEAFKGYDFAEEEKLALLSLKYMLLCKVMMDEPDDVNKLLSGKLASKYSGSDLEALRAIAAAVKARSLADFNAAFDAYPQELRKDPVVSEHFNSLSERMLEKDLNRIILPYSNVEIDHIAACVGMDREKVEKKLSQMILDQKLSGSLDQNDGTLTVHDSPSPDVTYEIALSTIHTLDEIVDVLCERAKKLW
ncbi:unnamed protein product [Angiostrongylus costaricensis]|uniref:PCI domain-containing protein n=1 Tax=Angiostrongylus costaricensis TaxID=334426 RepID=A0A0R3PI11_ANGCS|nr:unnamed protein product [Angiostrongylus costaricensis]